MTVFQYLGLGLVCALSLAILISGLRGQTRFMSVLLWLLLFGSAAVALIFPDSTTIVASAIGIERGADLISYCGILAGLVAFWWIYTRMRRFERQLTLLVREMALQDAPAISEKKGDVA